MNEGLKLIKEGEFVEKDGLATGGYCSLGGTGVSCPANAAAVWLVPAGPDLHVTAA
jgi:hypothetical protein